MLVKSLIEGIEHLERGARENLGIGPLPRDFQRDIDRREQRGAAARAAVALGNERLAEQLLNGAGVYVDNPAWHSTNRKGW